MKIAIIPQLLYLVSIAAALAADSLSLFITLPETAARSTLSDVREYILREEGIITHEFHLIKAFAVELPRHAVESLRVWGAERGIVVEEDQEVNTNGDLKL